MKVALLTAHSRISPFFASTSIWLKVKVTENECLICSTEHFQTSNEFDMINELLEQNIEMIVCGAIPYYLEKIAINQGCDIFSFIAGDIDDVINALHQKELDNPKFRMPGCQKRKKRGKNIFCRHNNGQ